MSSIFTKIINGEIPSHVLTQDDRFFSFLDVRPIAAGQELPYVVAIIALEDAGGVRMISNVVDASPDELEIGLPVELVWEDMSADLAIPRFRLSGR